MMVFLELRQIVSFYGMERSLSLGMKLLFKRYGYRFQGCLVNHCDIMGQFEDVNLWVKPSSQPIPI